MRHCATSGDSSKVPNIDLTYYEIKVKGEGKGSPFIGY